MKAADLDDFLNQTFFSLDVRTMLGDVEDFLSFSESNLSWQKQRELRRAEQEAAEVKFVGEDARFEASYRDSLIENATYRFDVSLTQRVRYAALSALITTVEWCAVTLQRRATFEFPAKPKRKNLAVHILETLNIQTGLDDPSADILQVEALILVRNCVIHEAGLIEHHKHKDDLRSGLQILSGMQLSNKNFLGESVEIEVGALEAAIARIGTWLTALEKRSIENGFIK